MVCKISTYFSFRNLVTWAFNLPRVDRSPSIAFQRVFSLSVGFKDNEPDNRLGQDILPAVCGWGRLWWDSLLRRQNFTRRQWPWDIWGFANGKTLSCKSYGSASFTTFQYFKQIGHTVHGPEDTAQQLKQLLGISWAEVTVTFSTPAENDQVFQTCDQQTKTFPLKFSCDIF